MIAVPPLPAARAARVTIERIPHEVDRLAAQVAGFAVALRAHRRCSCRADFERLAAAPHGSCDGIDAIAAACPSSRPPRLGEG